MVIYLPSYHLSLNFYYMDWQEKSPKDNFKNAICYIPLVAVLLYVVLENKTEEQLKNIKYGMYLLGLYVIITTLMAFTLFLAPLIIIVHFFYIWMSVYYWYKAYKWDDVRIEFIDKLDEKINNKK